MEGEYLDVCKGEAKEDLETKDCLHQLADVYVEASGCAEKRQDPLENLVHSMRRATTLHARLAYDTASMTQRILIFTIVVAVSAVIALIPMIARAVKFLFCSGI